MPDTGNKRAVIAELIETCSEAQVAEVYAILTGDKKPAVEQTVVAPAPRVSKKAEKIKEEAEGEAKEAAPPAE